MRMSRFFASLFIAGIAVLGVAAAFGQEYPAKPVRIFAPPAGGGADIVARQIGQGISGPLGQPVIVENRAAGAIPEIVAKSAPDGYALLIASNSFWTGPLLRKTPYDPVNDFVPISMTSRSPSILVVHPSLPVKSVKELIALVKARPGELNYSSTVTGSGTHLMAELFKSIAGINIVRVSYAGGALPVTAVLGGEVQMTFVSPPAGMPHVKSGRFRALAITSDQPSPLVPGVPTMAAAGVPGYRMLSVDGILAPAGTPAAIINRLNQEIVRFLSAPETKERFFATGAEAAGSSPKELLAFIQSEMATLGKVIKEAGIKAD